MKNIEHSIKENLTSKDWWKSWLGIFLGTVIMASGYVYFINPYNIIPGGTYGASIVLHNLFPSIQVGTFGYMFDIPLLVIAALFLGAKIGTRTLAASMVTPLIMNVLSMWAYPDEASLQSLDPTKLLSGRLDMSDQLMLTCLIGSWLIGLGCGIVVRCGATTGGSDIVGMIIQKYCKIKFSSAILMVDGTVVLFGLIVIGFGVGSDAPVEADSCILSLYSLLSIFVISRIIAYTISGSKDDKLLFVISSKPLPELHDYILHDLDRTATLIKSSGLYTGGDKEMLFIVVRNKEVPEMKAQIKMADPSAFVIVTDAHATFGEGWKTLPNKGEITPE